MAGFVKNIKDCENDEIGTKILNLKLVSEKTNFSIPTTIVIVKSAYRKILEENSITDCQNFDWSKLILPHDLEVEILSEIEKTFGNTPLVVRSSASCEDSPLLSFAGQYSSFLNITGKEKILKAIRLCYQSLFSENAVIYAQNSGIDLNSQYMAVGIQNLAKIEMSGVMFTSNPIDGNANEILVEYGKGLGDTIVGGSSVPILARIQKDTVESAKPDFIKAIAKIGIEVEKVFSHSQDIEWGMNGDLFYLCLLYTSDAADE